MKTKGINRSSVTKRKRGEKKETAVCEAFRGCGLRGRKEKRATVAWYPRKGRPQRGSSLKNRKGWRVSWESQGRTS